MHSTGMHEDCPDWVGYELRTTRVRCSPVCGEPLFFVLLGDGALWRELGPPVWFPQRASCVHEVFCPLPSLLKVWSCLRFRRCGGSFLSFVSLAYPRLGIIAPPGGGIQWSCFAEAWGELQVATRGNHDVQVLLGKLKGRRTGE